VTRKPTHVTSRDNALLVRLRKLARHPGEYRKVGQVLLQGEHLCAAWAARAGPPALHAVISQSAWQEGRFLALTDTAAATAVVGDAAMAEIGTLDTPAPIAFVVPLPEPVPIDAMRPSVILDQVQDAGNVGSILRSASAFGFTQVIALRGTASIWSTKVLRAGMGAHFGLTLHEGTEPEALAALAVPVFATSSHASEDLARSELAWPCAWVFGNEGEGISPTVAARCAKSYRIAQPGGEESLNVAVAAGICLHESARRRAGGDAGVSLRR
jgi:TrmH family RNA methyltransferase